ncbi:biopolymer transport membrane proton channel TolQ-like protein [Candidatus Magnetomorum sp. HK-1]|nr:biopolymer transport membrane proton channel TolQ-like protein [Candidatus Magnetomorum sp. HK-1]
MSKEKINAIENGSQIAASETLAEFIVIQKNEVYKNYRAGNNKIFYPEAFLTDAIQQISENYFEKKFISPISMLANLLPPLGFVGTIFGMSIIFGALGNGSNSPENIEGISTALLTTLAALVVFVILEYIGMLLISRANKRIHEGLSVSIQ